MATTKRNRAASVAALPTSSDAEPWARQPSETARAFAAFVRYRDLPASERSIHKSQPAGNSAQDLRQRSAWCAAHQWVARSTLWDEHRDRVARTAELVEIRAMGERHAEAAQALVKKGLAALSKLKLAEMTPTEIARFIVEGAKLERIARGEPAEMPEHGGGAAATSSQSIVRELLSSDPEVAKQAALLGAQILRVESEREESRDGA